MAKNSLVAEEHREDPLVVEVDSYLNTLIFLIGSSTILIPVAKEYLLRLRSHYFHKVPGFSLLKILDLAFVKSVLHEFLKKI